MGARASLDVPRADEHFAVGVAPMRDGIGVTDGA